MPSMCFDSAVVSIVLQNIEVKDEAISAIYACPKGRKGSAADVVPVVYLKGLTVFPSFVDVHTHIVCTKMHLVLSPFLPELV